MTNFPYAPMGARLRDLALPQRVDQLEYALDQLARLYLEHGERLDAVESRYGIDRIDNHEEEEQG